MDEITRVCSFCQGRLAASALARSEALGWTCTDFDACTERAGHGDLYSSREDELETAAREARQGAAVPR